MWYSMWKEGGRHIVAFAPTTRGVPRVVINASSAARATVLAAEHREAQRRPRLKRKGTGTGKRKSKMTPERAARIAARLAAKRERVRVARTRRAERREQMLAAKAARRARRKALRRQAVLNVRAMLAAYDIARAEAARAAG